MIIDTTPMIFIITEIINGVLTSPIDLNPVVIERPIASKGRKGAKYFR